MNNELLNELQAWEHGLGSASDNNYVLASTFIAQPETMNVANEQLQAKLLERNFHLSILAKNQGGTRTSWLYAWLLSSLTTRRTISAMPASLYSHGPLNLLELEGNKQQKLLISELVKGGRQVCFAMAEPNTGSNLLAIDCRAEQTESGWLITGTKGIIGLPANASHAVILAKTAVAGPASLSFFLVDIQDQTKVARTYFASKGMRDQLFGQLTFNQFSVANDALIGQQGFAFESALKVQQYVKFMSTAASHGGCHNLLRQVSVYAQERHLTEHAHVRFLLAKSMAALYTLEATVFVSASLQSLPKKQFSIATSVCKSIAIAVADEVMATVKMLLCSNGVIDVKPIYAIATKIIDDLEMVRSIDTNPVTNLNNIVAQLSALQFKTEQRKEEDKLIHFNDIITLFDVECTLLSDTPTTASVTNVDGDYLLTAITVLPEQLFHLVEDKYLAKFTAIAQCLSAALKAFWQKLASLNDKSTHARKSSADIKSVARLELASEFCQIYSASAMLLLWVANYKRFSQLMDVDVFLWLLAARVSPETNLVSDCDDAYSFLAMNIKKSQSLSWLSVNLEQ